MIEVQIERLGHQGDGIAPGPVFVTGCLPGELVPGEVEAGRMIAPRIVTPSVDRVRAPCIHAKSCGGCTLQHASDDFVAGFKKQVVETALEAQGLEASIKSIETSPSKSRRRATFSARRTKKGAIAGFHAKGSDALVDISDCQLLKPSLVDALEAAKALTICGGSRKGELKITVTDSLAGLDVSVEDVRIADRALQGELAAIANQFGLARLTWAGDLIAQMSPPIQRFGAAAVCPPPGAFLQATEHGENTLVSAVLETVSGADHVLDLFAGCGTFTLPIAKTSEVHAVESEPEMLSALDQGWRNTSGLKKVTTEARDLFRRPFLPDELKRFDAVVLDPPRAGAEAQIRELAKSDVTRVSMVSCNPISFARDARALVNAGFQMRNIVVVDQFRWSTHIEIAAKFDR